MRVPRISYRPRVEIAANGAVAFNPSGCLSAKICRLLAPSPEECRRMLIEVRRHRQLSAEAMAALLGTSRICVRSWERAWRNPSGTSRRLIWIVHKLTFDPAALQQPGAWLTWGEMDERKIVQNAREAVARLADKPSNPESAQPHPGTAAPPPPPAAPPLTATASL